MGALTSRWSAMSEKRRKAETERAARKAAQANEAMPLQRDAQGRAHLVIHRDAQGRAQRLALSQPLFNDTWQNDVATAAASTAHGLMSEGRTLAKAIQLGRSAMAGTSKIADGLLANSTGPTPACRSGCAHCCYQAVGVSAPEAFA